MRFWNVTTSINTRLVAIVYAKFPFMGDASCRFNARSELLRCAINPSGPCQDCRFYETINP
jgi:hypothetical protein